MGTSPDIARRWFDEPRGIAVLWAGVLAGPTAWALDLTISYAIVQWTCGGGPPVTLHLITLFSLAMIGAGAFGSWRALRAVPEGAPQDGSQPDQRGYFMALLGLSMCALFAMVVIAGAIPRWVLDACQQ
ncbi:MAG: hypothetical protein JSU08_09775 [Acidobacteria bacterium]|nr:hypothetical protein [Acidobacteriota bacterium]